MKAAIAEFAENGFEHANTNRIAKSADISVGSLFKYFDSKEDLFISTVKYGEADLKAQLNSLAGETEGFFETVEKLLRTVQQHSRNNESMIRLYNEMTAHGSPSLVYQEVDWLESFTAGLYARLIEKAIADGTVRPDCDAGMFAFLLDNLFMMLQFSYTCGYYKERFRVFAGSDILQKDDFVVEQAMKFIRSAFTRQ
ncbi:MAG: TetR/AcrR family transcriptional regulator [Oscillospiraceae bacterium]|nr:TetR/AcrR family transcriptional regulator [Oscillospiraceae bacterium]